MPPKIGPAGMFWSGVVVVVFDLVVRGLLMSASPTTVVTSELWSFAAQWYSPFAGFLQTLGAALVVGALVVRYLERSDDDAAEA